MDLIRAREFLDKADKHLRWCDRYLGEMREQGRKGQIDHVERIFISLLSHIDTAHEALIDCAKKIEMEKWRNNLNAMRENDPLLHYLWQARNSETHDALVKWRPSMKCVDFRIVDAERAKRIGDPARLGQRAAISSLYCFLYEVKSEQELIEKMKTCPIPSRERQSHAGVELLHALDSLSLDSFTHGRGRRKRTVSAPTSHLGANLPPSADQSVDFGLKFYRIKLVELTKVIGEINLSTQASESSGGTSA